MTEWEIDYHRMNKVASDLSIGCARLQGERDVLRELIKKVHTAKGRYHTQLAMCDLFDAVGLSNERPTTKTRLATREEKIVRPGIYEVKV